MSQLPDRYTYAAGSLQEALGGLYGLALGLMADKTLTDAEITFLHGWLEQRYSMMSAFPGNVIYNRVKEVLADGVVTEAERAHLVDTLNFLIEGQLANLTDDVELTALWFDEVDLITFDQSRFCLTGNFIFGPRSVCQQAIERLGGEVDASVSLEPNFVVVGGLGLDEWRSGQLGAELETAMALRQKGRPLKIIHEDALVSQPGMVAP